MNWAQKTEFPPKFPSQVNRLTQFTPFICSCFQGVEYSVFLLQRKCYFRVFFFVEAEVARVITKLLMLIQLKRPFKAWLNIT